jgi:putative peptidoglycan lipid II flippase
MSTPDGEGWSTPSVYRRGEIFSPPTFADNDPLSALLLDWDEPEPDTEQWGRATYVGPRRLLPGTVPASEIIDSSRPSPTDGPPVALDQPPTTRSAARRGRNEQSTRGLMANSRTMAVASLVSRLTGFLRSSLLVAALGIGAVGNAYNSANNFPNMVYELLLGGVLSSVLIPLLVKAQAEDTDDGVAYTQRLLSIAAAALGVITLAAVAAAPLIAGAFAPAGPQRELTTLFATLLLPEIFFYGLGAMFMAVLNIRHSYGPGTWAPVLNNVIMICTVVIFWLLPGPKTLNPANMTTAQVLVIGIGTTLGIVAQALVLVPSLRRTGFHWQWRFRARPNEVGRMREVATLAGWVLGYVVASQVGVTVIQKIGNNNGGFTVFTYADLLFQMPYGILVVSLLTAIMPRMSRAAARGDNQAVVADLSLGARLSVVAMLPITAGLIVLGPSLGVVLFAYHRASIAEGRLIGSTLAFSAFGLVFFAVVMLQLRVFYAMRNGRTPTLINVFMVGTKIGLVLLTNALFHYPKATKTNPLPSVHAVEWLSIATSASYVVGAVVGHVVLTRRLGHLGFRAVVATALRIAVASGIGALAAYAVVLGCQSAFGKGHGGAVAGLVAGAAIGLLVMLVVAWRMRIPEVRELAALVRRRAGSGESGPT